MFMLFSGATHSTLVLIDSEGCIVLELKGGPGLNCLLNGVERSADQIAEWIRSLNYWMENEEGFGLPIASLVVSFYEKNIFSKAFQLVREWVFPERKMMRLIKGKDQRK